MSARGSQLAERRTPPRRLWDPPRDMSTRAPPFLRQVLVGRTDRDTGAEVRCAEAEAHLASIHGLAELLGVAPAEGADGEARE